MLTEEASTDLVPQWHSLGEGLSKLGVNVEDVLQLVEQDVHLSLAQNGRITLLQWELVVLDQPPQRGQVVVLAVDQAGDDVPPLGLLGGEEERGGGEGGRTLLAVPCPGVLLLLRHPRHPRLLAPVEAGPGPAQGPPEGEQPGEARLGQVGGGAEAGPGGELLL